MPNYKVTATFQHESVKGETRTFHFTSLKAAEDCVAAGQKADQLMNLMMTGWEVDYSIEEVDELPLDGAILSIKYPDGHTVEHECESWDEAEQMGQLIHELDAITGNSTKFTIRSRIETVA